MKKKNKNKDPFAPKPVKALTVYEPDPRYKYLIIVNPPPTTLAKNLLPPSLNDPGGKEKYEHDLAVDWLQEWISFMFGRDNALQAVYVKSTVRLLLEPSQSAPDDLPAARLTK